MPYDKNGKYYRKPVYKVEKTKKDLPQPKNKVEKTKNDLALKKRKDFVFYILGLITPFVFIFYCYLILTLIVNIPQIPSAKFFIILFLLALIPFILIFYRFHKSQVRNYLKRGGKLTKKKIVILNTLWWLTVLIPTLIIFYVFFTWVVMLFMFLPGQDHLLELFERLTWWIK